MRQLLEVDKIIWAVDAFSERVMLQRAAAWAIQELTEGSPSSVIQPVYLVNDYTAERSVSPRLVRSFIEKIEAFGNDSLSRIISRIPLSGVRPLRVISRPFASIAEGVTELLETAEQQGGQLIVASTRAGKGGNSPFALPGSFVEALAEHSDLPILVVNPRWKRAAGIPSVLFPSDLSPESHEWFLRTLEFAKTATAKVTLFHKIDFPLSQPFEVASRIFPGIRDILYRKIREARSEATQWTRIAKQAGVRLSVIIDSKMSGSLSDAVLACLERHPGAVVIAPPLSLTYPRSTIRKLMKRAPYPMLYIPATVGRERRVQGTRRVAA